MTDEPLTDEVLQKRAAERRERLMHAIKHAERRITTITANLRLWERRHNAALTGLAVVDAVLRGDIDSLPVLGKEKP